VLIEGRNLPEDSRDVLKQLKLSPIQSKTAWRLSSSSHGVDDENVLEELQQWQLGFDSTELMQEWLNAIVEQSRWAMRAYAHGEA
jgi:hypothetical protein